MITKYLKHIAPAMLTAVSFGLASCVGDLDVTPKDPSTLMEVNSEALFTKCYSSMALQGQDGATSASDCDISGYDGGTVGFVRQLFNSNELTTDESICCWGDEGIPAFNFNQWSSSHPMLEGFYYRLMFNISVCNQYLEVASDVDATMTAEVRFLRALYYYHMMDAFGNVPFTTQVSSENPKQMSRADLYEWIENELLDCMDDMSEPTVKTSSDEGYGRADRSAAWLLLSRLYLNAEVYTGTPQWAKAAEYAQKVIDSPHKLFTQGNGNYSAYQMLFMGDNGENGSSIETMLPLLQDGVTTTSWCCSIFLIASTSKSDEDPSRGTTEVWAGNRARKEFVEKFFPADDAPTGTPTEVAAAAGDDRALFYTINRQLEIPDGGTGEFTNGYTVSKFTNVYSTDGAPHNNKFVDTDFFLMRSAEAYLTYAEATARLEGTGNTTAEGTAYINQLRTRAHASTKNVYTLEQVLDEWSREFYYEGRRRIDLVRYGYFGGQSNYTWSWKGGTVNGRNFDEHLNIFAIPETDLNANSNLKQNPGY